MELRQRCPPDIIQSSDPQDSLYKVVAQTRLPVLQGVVMELSLWEPEDGSDEILLLQHGSASDATGDALVRVQSACLTGEVFGSLRCDCGPQLRAALQAIAESDWGIVVYPLRHEGRGIGLLNKLRAYAWQDQGLDTFEANRVLGFDDDARDYTGVSAVLHSVGARKIHLLSRNPTKADALRRRGIVISQVSPLDQGPNPFSNTYLDTKYAWFERLGHASKAPIHPQALAE